MNVKESIEQLKSLIEHFNNSGNDFNATDIEAIKFLLKENQQLKQKYENAVADYEKTMFEKEQLNSLVNSCQEEIRQLKKQVENYKELGFKYLQDKNNKLETQQKEFIEWLKDMLDNENDIFSVVRVKDILQKYKEIIGISNNKITKLEQALDEIEKYIKNNKRKSETHIYGIEVPEYIFTGDIEDILKIIQKAKGDFKNEN